MKRRYRRIHSASLACAVMASLLVCGGGCSSNKAGMTAPELPAKHWLDDAPGIPIENKAKYDAAVPNLYEPNKKFGFEDCVYLTIQQAPSLVNSAVEVEIKRMDQADAAWKYLPEPHMWLRISQNITRYNQDMKGIEGEYGKTQYEIGFHAPFPNPMATYFEHKARSVMTSVAISMHRKAVGETIAKIAEAYLRLQAQQYTLAAKKTLIPLAEELVSYWKEVERVEGNQGSRLMQAQQYLREAKLTVEKAEMEEKIERTKLKVLAGLNADQKFDIDVEHADDIVKGFNRDQERWESNWEESENNVLLHTQIKLADYNIMLAWAQYVPNMSMAVNMSPPRGQSQPANGTADQFFHFSFDFPLIDWGRRYRGVQTARMKKAQAFHFLSEKRFTYQSKWMQASQQLDLARTNVDLAETRYKKAQMRYEEARIGFEHGLEQLPRVAECQQGMVQEQIAYIEAERDHRLAKLQLMFIAGKLQNRFLGLPSRELAEFAGVKKRTVSGNELLGMKPEEKPEAEKPVFQEPAKPNQPVKEEKPKKSQ